MQARWVNKQPCVLPESWRSLMLGVSMRAQPEAGPQATGPAGRLDAVGRLYAENASKMVWACTEMQAGRVS